MLVSCTDLVGECGHAKVTKNKFAQKKSFHLEPVHKQAFEKKKQLIALETYTDRVTIEHVL